MSQHPDAYKVSILDHYTTPSCIIQEPKINNYFKSPEHYEFYKSDLIKFSNIRLSNTLGYFGADKFCAIIFITASADDFLSYWDAPSMPNYNKSNFFSFGCLYTVFTKRPDKCPELIDWQQTNFDIELLQDIQACFSHHKNDVKINHAVFFNQDFFNLYKLSLLPFIHNSIEIDSQFSCKLFAQLFGETILKFSDALSSELSLELIQCGDFVLEELALFFINYYSSTHWLDYLMNETPTIEIVMKREQSLRILFQKPIFVSTAFKHGCEFFTQFYDLKNIIENHPQYFS